MRTEVNSSNRNSVFLEDLRKSSVDFPESSQGEKTARDPGLIGDEHEFEPAFLQSTKSFKNVRVKSHPTKISEIPAFL